MKPSYHILTSGLLGALSWLYFRTLGYPLILFFTGTFIDLDHIIDYGLNYRFTLKLKDIYRACMDINLKRLYLFFHSYELIIILWGLIFAIPLGNFWKAIALGITQHVVFDQFTNPMDGLGYFLAYRISRGFEKDRLLRLKTKG